MNLRRTFDVSEIESVLKHDDIWPNIACESQDKNTFVAPITDDIHYLFSPGILFILHPVNDKLQIHANVVKSSREYAKDAATNAIQYGFNVLGAKTIFCSIPDKYENVLKFAKNFLKYDCYSDGKHYLSAESKEWAL